MKFEDIDTREEGCLLTDRLLLRPWRESDAAALYELASDPLVGPSAGWPAHTSEEDSALVIRDVLAKDDNYAITLRETGELIGCVGLIMPSEQRNSAQIADEDVELGYWLGVPHWGHGYMTEAVTELLDHYLLPQRFTAAWGGYYDGNDNSRRVLARCGFTHHHSEADKDVPLLGETRTEHFMRLSAETWRQRAR
jgi:RimJ/RimL family protein N-acetyltransferase